MQGALSWMGLGDFSVSTVCPDYVKDVRATANGSGRQGGGDTQGEGEKRRRIYVNW